MTDKINLILTMLKDGNTQKNDYIPFLKELDEFVSQYLKDINFVYKEPKNIFYQTTDERLASSIDKKQQLKDNPQIAIQENTKSMLDILNSFISKYHIGYIREAKLQKNGFVSVVIPCLTTKRSSFGNDKEFSSQLTFEAQIDFLKEKGFELTDEKYIGLQLTSSSQNIELIKKTLEDRDATHIKIHLYDNVIDKIEFWVHLSNINKFKEEPIEIELPVSDTELNIDEINKAIKNLKEMYIVFKDINNFDGDTKQTCISLFETYFANVCEAFGFESETSKRVNARHEDERNKNLEIQKIEKEIGSTLSEDEIIKCVEDYSKCFSEYAETRLSFNVSNFTIDKYGFFNVELNYISASYIPRVSVPSDKRMKEIFEMSNGKRSNEDFFILDTYNNKTKILDILKEICPSIRIVDFSIKTVNNAFIINELKLVIDDISSFNKEIL